MARGLSEWQRFEPEIKALSTLNYNYDDSDQRTLTRRMGWHVDSYCSRITDEPPGEALVDGPFARAREILRTYRFPPPALVQGIFRPDIQLEGRDMLLRARFLGFTFYFGTRVNKVIDEIRFDSARGAYRSWGYSYRTLKGHFEMGEIKFEIAKYFETGHIEFHINAYSKSDLIPQPLYRWGFKIFGRLLQKIFAISSMRRMKRLVLEGGPRPKPVSPLW